MNDQNQISNNLRKSVRHAKRIDFKLFDQKGIIQEVGQLTNEGVNDAMIKSKGQHFIDINTSTVTNIENQDIEIQEIPILFNNINILSPNSTVDQQKC